MSSETDPTRVGVVGGGAVGLSTALELATRGVSVTVFERDQPGSGATGRAAGICYDAYADDRDATMAGESLERFRDLGLVTECPYLWFAREEDEVASALRDQAERMRTNGREVSLVDPETVGERFPAMVTEDITVAALAHNSGTVDTDEYLDVVESRARKRGVSIRTGVRASVTPDGNVETRDQTVPVDAVAVTAGAHTDDVLAPTDIDLAFARYRTQAVTAGEFDSSLPIYYDASEELYARPTVDGVLAGDGSHAYDGDPNCYETGADVDFLERRVAELNRRLRPELSVRNSWAGLCTATPDRDPLIGECGPGIYVGTGFCGHGFMRAPALGELLAELILGDRETTPFDPLRFDGDESIELPLGITE